MMKEANRLRDWRPDPRTPRSRACPDGWRRIRQIRETCSHASKNITSCMPMVLTALYSLMNSSITSFHLCKSVTSYRIKKKEREHRLVHTTCSYRPPTERLLMKIVETVGREKTGRRREEENKSEGKGTTGSWSTRRLKMRLRMKAILQRKTKASSAAHNRSSI